MVRTAVLMIGILALLTILAAGGLAQGIPAHAGGGESSGATYGHGSVQHPMTQGIWGQMGGGGNGGGFTASNPAGDLLRGQGIYLQGLGQYIALSAQADSMRLQSALALDQYMTDSVREDNRAKAEHRAAAKARKIETHEAILQRIREDPSYADLQKGDALNDLRDQLLGPGGTPSAHGAITVAIPGEAIRQIPFQYASAAATFSMERMLAREEWPVALRGEAFARNRVAYERAVDAALYLAVVGKTSKEAVEAMRVAVRDLQEKLEQTIRQGDHDLYNPARSYLKVLAETPRLFTIRPVERVLVDVERYHGTTVGDLVMFMNKHELRFGVARTEAERELYRHLYAGLIQQREALALPPRPVRSARVPGS
jgi:hypothetical protein